MVAVQVGQDDAVQGRKLLRRQGRLGDPAAHQPVPEVRGLAAVQEVGVRQQGQLAVPEQDRRVADEVEVERVVEGSHGGSSSDGPVPVCGLCGAVPSAPEYPGPDM
ncbi:hypothetical protein GCM10010521_13060 [Streptomyces rameus]|uniref:Uncharacterized protein n=1 Tax=Streptomyces rameus TaxID=68261 RepID=A0ABP6MW98_9ACTN